MASSAPAFALAAAAGVNSGPMKLQAGRFPGKLRNRRTGRLGHDHPLATEPRPRRLGDFADCESDGHYLCAECCHKLPAGEAL